MSKTAPFDGKARERHDTQPPFIFGNIMRIPLLHHLPFLSGLRSEAASNPKDFRPLPKSVDAADRQLWAGQLGPAQKLLAQMNEEVDLSAVHAMQRSVRSMNASTRAVNPGTLLKTLPPGLERGAPASPELHANRVANDTILMATPSGKEASLWAAACIQHHVGHVVDLSTGPETDRIQACMAFSAPWLQGGLSARFDEAAQYREHQGGDPAKSLKHLHRDAESRSIEVSLRGAGEESFGTQQLAWTTVPVGKNVAISPRTLLEVSRHVDGLRLPRGESVAFQCADGDHRGAVFAAAHAIYQRFRAGRVDAGSLERAVTEACINLRLRRDTTLFNEAEHVASLLTFGQLMLKEDVAHPKGPAAVTGPSAPLRSAMKGARPSKADVPSGTRIRFNETTEVQGFTDREAAKRSLGRFNGALGAPLEQLKEEKNLNRGRRKD